MNGTVFTIDLNFVLEQLAPNSSPWPFLPLITDVNALIDFGLLLHDIIII
jgi:hypothetical protein